ncbi:hypothetical protein [Thermodesulforhabdus norvegica]|nr:hypothetical protein [Thermodesulforhabdus norvegica]
MENGKRRRIDECLMALWHDTENFASGPFPNCRGLTVPSVGSG